MQNPRQLQEALEQRAQLEVSGGGTLAAVTELAGLGMDFLSCGALTKDVRAVDFSLRLDGVKMP